MPTIKTTGKPVENVTVVYTGPAPEVEGAGFVFPRNEPVEVSAALAGTLGGDFQVVEREDK